MIIQDNIVKPAEKYDFALRTLYTNCGYKLYNMSRFEEYDLYAGNKDFLVSDDVITFKDTNGKLMALKPDITLSIVKNGKDVPGEVQKFYYSEKVYRVSESVHAFREITQTGVEVIGMNSDESAAEVLILAANSLKEFSDNYILEFSDIDVLIELIDRLGIGEASRPQVLKFIKEKNLHDLRAFCRDMGAEDKNIDNLCLILEDGTNEEICERIKSVGGCGKSLEKIQKLITKLEQNGLIDSIRLDMSLVSDINYYNGITFRGFIYGVPSRVLSGGQYDRLMEKMNRKSKAIGFAVYLDELERINK